jgi:hypothetical protein
MQNNEPMITTPVPARVTSVNIDEKSGRQSIGCSVNNNFLPWMTSFPTLRANGIVVDNPQHANNLELKVGDYITPECYYYLSPDKKYHNFILTGYKLVSKVVAETNTATLDGIASQATKKKAKKTTK